jgi:D-3-phosphoglycerate dehydrogenase
MPRVLISDKLEAPGLDLLRQAGLEVDNRPGLSGSALQEAVQAADGLIVRSGTRVTAELLTHPGNLRAVVRAGVGVDNIDVAAATRRGIVVMNTPGGNTVSTPPPTAAPSRASGSAASSSAPSWQARPSASSAWGASAVRSPAAPPAST